MFKWDQMAWAQVAAQIIQMIQIVQMVQMVKWFKKMLYLGWNHHHLRYSKFTINLKIGWLSGVFRTCPSRSPKVSILVWSRALSDSSLVARQTWLWEATLSRCRSCWDCKIVLSRWVWTNFWNSFHLNLFEPYWIWTESDSIWTRSIWSIWIESEHSILFESEPSLNPGNLFEYEPTWNRFNWFKFER